MRDKLLCASVALLMAQSAQAVTIKVTTTTDENGENASACSLREAIQAASIKQAFGGCPSGERYITDVIQLEAKTYTLTQGALKPTRELTVLGARGTSEAVLDPFTSSFPGRVPLTTTIVASSNARIFDTSEQRAPLALGDLILKNGKATGHGGAILAGSRLDLTRVDLLDNQASGAGGAIYLEGVSSTLQAEQVNIRGSHGGAGLPAVLGMSCYGRLEITPRTVSFNQSSLTDNGDASANSILDFCGIVTGTLNATTLGQNQVSAVSGSAVLRMLDDKGTAVGTRVANSSAVTLSAITLVKNSGAAGVAYDDSGRWLMSDSVLAFNDTPLQCRYHGVRPVADISTFSHGNNFLGGSKNPVYGNTVTAYATEQCQIPQRLYDDRTVYQGQTTFAQALLPLGDYNSFGLGYLPNPQTRVLVDQGNEGECGGTDQRGASRLSGVRTPGKYFEGVGCDFGALEYQQLTAYSDSGSSDNVSYRTALDKKLPQATDQQKAEMSDEDKALFARLTDSISEEIEVYRQQYSYRRIFVDILANDIPQEQPQPGSTPASLVSPLKRNGQTSSPYTVTAESLGTGAIGADLGGLKDDDFKPGTNTDVVKCAWIQSPKGYFDRLAIWRTDGRLTPVGQVERCKYTIKSGGKEVSNVAYARISNHAPIAENDEVTLKYGETSIALDILANDHDDGDGPIDANNDKLYDSGVMGVAADRVGTPIFYRDPLQPDPTRQAYIRIVKKPALGTLKFEYEGGCPDNSSSTEQSSCFGGKLTYVPYSNYSKFNDSFTYVVYDRDMTASNEATVQVINTATTNDYEKAGGGAAGVFGVLGLLGIWAARHRGRKQHA